MISVSAAIVSVLLSYSTVHADLLGDITSNVHNLVQPVHSAAESFVGNLGSNIASIADQAGNAVASVATQAAVDVDHNQENKVNSELSSFEKSSGNKLYARVAGALIAIPVVFATFI